MSKLIRYQLRNKWALILLIFLVIFSIFTVPLFATASNINNIMQQVSVNGIVAAGMTLTILTGGFDLSVGSVMALTGVVTMKCMEYGTIPAILIGLCIGLIAGFINGVLIEIVGINPFIATLGMMGVIRGLVLGITDARPVSVWNETFAQFSNKTLGIFPVPLIFMLLYVAMLELFIKRTRVGHSIYIYGSNRDAGFLQGLNMKRTLITAYTLCGFSASIAGIFLASRLSTGSPVIAEDAALLAIAAAVLGGTSLAGGRGSVVRTIVGVLILGILTNVMNLMEIISYYQTIIKGMLVVIVVLIDAPTVKKIFSGTACKKLWIKKVNKVE